MFYCILLNIRGDGSPENKAKQIEKTFADFNLKVISMMSQSNFKVNLHEKEEFTFSKLNVSTILGNNQHLGPNSEKKINMKVSLESPNLKKSLIKGSERFSKMKHKVECFDQLMKLSEILENERSVEVFFKK